MSSRLYSSFIPTARSTMFDRRRFLTALSVFAAGATYGARAHALAGAEPSRTARSAALHRAAHQLLDRPRVFDDPLAVRMLGAGLAKWLALNLDRYDTPAARAMRAFLVTRARHAEDELERAHAGGVAQYVVLGAGLDTFAYRSPYGERVRVFEVDHPLTQQWKRAHLQTAGIDVPRSLAFVPVDFEKDALARQLAEAGFDAQAPAFISWLGVTMYLTPDAVMRTLRFVAESCAAGSAIVFDFSVPAAMLPAAQRLTRGAAAKRVAAIGEPWIGHFEPAALAEELRAMGYSAAETIGAAEANARYFAGRRDGLRVRGAAGRIMTARR
jgi:methyltransferase (TIGR00027 family)